MGGFLLFLVFFLRIVLVSLVKDTLLFLPINTLLHVTSQNSAFLHSVSALLYSKGYKKQHPKVLCNKSFHCEYFISTLLTRLSCRTSKLKH